MARAKRSILSCMCFGVPAIEDGNSATELQMHTTSSPNQSGPAQKAAQAAAQQLANVQHATDGTGRDSGKAPATAVRRLQKEDSALGLVELQGSKPGLADACQSGRTSSSNCSTHAARTNVGPACYRHAGDATRPAGSSQQKVPAQHMHSSSSAAAEGASPPGADAAGTAVCSQQQSSSTSCSSTSTVGGSAQPPQPSTSGRARPAAARASPLPQSTPAPACMQPSAFARQDALAAAVLSEVSQELPHLPAGAPSMAALRQAENAAATAAAEGVPAGMPPLPGGAASSSAVAPGQQVVLRGMGSSNNASSTGGSRRLRHEDSYVSLGGLSEAHSTTLGECCGDLTCHCAAVNLPI